MFKTRRQHRYEVLRTAGMLKLEAYPLSRVPFKIPYISPMIKQRHRDLERATKAGWSRRRFEASIRRDYEEKGWTRRNRLGRRVFDPWRMLRGFEEKYRAKFPSYESPWEKHRRDFRNFVAKIEKTIEKYPGRMPKVRLRYLPTGGAVIVK